MNLSLKEKVSKITSSPGVYIFKDSKKEILYIGKASNLKKRVFSYFTRPLNNKLKNLVDKALDIEVVETGSEIEALFLESELIKRYKPFFNVEWRDEKNFLYLEITKENFPGVFLVRQPADKASIYFGPFVESNILKKSLRILRQIFGFRTAKKFPHKLCFWGRIKKCPCSGISQDEYQKNIKALVNFLKGKTAKVINDLEKEMQKLAATHEYEKAALIRDKIDALKLLGQKHLFNDLTVDLKKDEGLLELANVLSLKNLSKKIEAYDISNIFGKEATGSMIVFEQGLPAKQLYRRFKIKTVSGINDYQMIAEVLQRRFGRFGGGDPAFKSLPDLIIIDGGKGHLSTALKVLKEKKLSIPTIALAKKNEEIYKMRDQGSEIRGKEKEVKFEKIVLPKTSASLKLLQRIRDESHRFAIAYHYLLRRKHFLKK